MPAIQPPDCAVLRELPRWQRHTGFPGANLGLLQHVCDGCAERTRRRRPELPRSGLPYQLAPVANPDSSHAVAVTCGGVVLGYIPEFESESLFNFLLTNRGMARVNSNINLRVAAKSSSVELDLTRPYKIVPGV